MPPGWRRPTAPFPRSPLAGPPWACRGVWPKGLRGKCCHLEVQASCCLARLDQQGFCGATNAMPTAPGPPRGGRRRPALASKLRWLGSGLRPMLLLNRCLSPAPPVCHRLLCLTRMRFIFILPPEENPIINNTPHVTIIPTVGGPSLTYPWVMRIATLKNALYGLHAPKDPQQPALEIRMQMAENAKRRGTRQHSPRMGHWCLNVPWHHPLREGNPARPSRNGPLTSSDPWLRQPLRSPPVPLLVCMLDP